MKKILLLILFSALLTGAYAQPNADSVAYQAQRKKINDMLAQRKQKFGQYDKSLSMHTGIFGLQTKKDIRRSNDILMDIVKTDEGIFTQTKILLEYRTFQQTQAQTHSTETDNTNVGFMNSINTLRAQNEKLKRDIQAAEEKQNKSTQTALALVVGLIIIVLLLLRAKYVKKG
jgi:Spy/CpxP family protein refolding chaperone